MLEEQMETNLSRVLLLSKRQASIVFYYLPLMHGSVTRCRVIINIHVTSILRGGIKS